MSYAVTRHKLYLCLYDPSSTPTSTMPRPTKVAGEKATAVPGGMSKKDTEADKKSKAAQKRLAPKRTTKPAPSQRRVLVVNIYPQYPVTCANKLLPSLIKPAAAKILNLLTETIRTMPHRRETNLSRELWSLCLTPLLVCVPRKPRILTNLVGVGVRLLTSHTFSSTIQSRTRSAEYVKYAGKSCITCQRASNDSIPSDKYGYEEVPLNMQNYIYTLGSGKTNCRNHVRNQHAAIYDKTVQENNWPYRLSTEPSAKTTVGELRKRALPSFTSESFIDYLVRFIVADDQVSNLFHSLTYVLTFS